MDGKFTRNPSARIAWRQTMTHDRFYWLALPPGAARQGQEVFAERNGSTFSLGQQRRPAADSAQRRMAIWINRSPSGAAKTSCFPDESRNDYGPPDVDGADRVGLLGDGGSSRADGESTEMAGGRSFLPLAGAGSFCFNCLIQSAWNQVVAAIRIASTALSILNALVTSQLVRFC